MIALSHHINQKPHFWTRENANSNAEVDLLHPYDGLLIPIEVKSGASGRLRSLHEFMDRCDHDIAVRFLRTKCNVEHIKTRNGKLYRPINLPYFAMGNLSNWLGWLVK